ncbi:ComEC/Rec2 family competence protein [Butyrivibrio sp. AC2005]|uniref:ComEC/Rec2 family competence protein n=1 Tax=Butyrivibrio sp. AC2005 TaxID=1280672 RepID=UPI00040570FE|nr:hypothetical protein [Butyrivibrio sp. AC2005]
MLEVYAYNAGKGDCIRLHFAGTHNIFIDSGVSQFGTTFKGLCDNIIAAGETLDVLILTHVDDDHIGGILSNLKKRSYICPFKEVWMNNYADTVSFGDRRLSVQQNNEVYAELLRRGVIVHEMKKGNTKNIAGATIETIWPDSIPRPDIRVQKDTNLTRHNDYRFTLSTLANRRIVKHDRSINNKKSIVFKFTYDDHKLLFTGDAWAVDVIKAAGEYDLIKMPHHGSAGNICEAYPKALKASNFLICTDGSSHPDKQTIAKLEHWYGKINIYSPTAWWNNGFFVDSDKTHKINYYKKDGLVISW